MIAATKQGIVMKSGKLSKIIWETEEYFLGMTENGWVRAGMLDSHAINFASTHPLYTECVTLTPDTIESFLDRMIEAGNIPL